MGEGLIGGNREGDGWRAPLPSGIGWLGPDRKFIAAGFDKVKTAATGEIKQGAVDGAAMLAHLGLGCLYIGAVEHQQGTP